MLLALVVCATLVAQPGWLTLSGKPTLMPVFLAVWTVLSVREGLADTRVVVARIGCVF